MTPTSRQSESEPRIEIGSLPGRKHKALSVLEGTVLYPVAYFRDDASYERFKNATKGAARLIWEDS